MPRGGRGTAGGRRGRGRGQHTLFATAFLVIHRARRVRVEALETLSQRRARLAGRNLPALDETCTW
eukprot:3350517-Pleurochrysis_carterae.AAC.1